jgi:hypothetical protein
VDIAKLLCEFGAGAVYTTSNDSCYALRVLRYCILKLAERHFEHMAREQIQEGVYLQVVTGMGNMPMVKLLLDNGASTTARLQTESPINGMPISDYAVYKDHMEIARILREYEPTADRSIVSLQESEVRLVDDSSIDISIFARHKEKAS